MDRVFRLRVKSVRSNPKDPDQRIVGIEENNEDSAAFKPVVKFPYHASSHFSFYLDCSPAEVIQKGDVIVVKLEGTAKFTRWRLQKVIPESVPDSESKTNSANVSNTNQSPSTVSNPEPLPGVCLPTYPFSAPTTPARPQAALPSATGISSVSLPSSPSVVSPYGALTSQLPSSSTKSILYSVMMEEDAKTALRFSELERKHIELAADIAQMKKEQAITNRLLREIRGILRDLKLRDEDEDGDPTEEDEIFELKGK